MSITAAENLLEWLRSVNGYIHPSLSITIDPDYGLIVQSTESIDPDERLISCPFDVAVTSSLAVSAICAVLGITEDALVYTSKPGDAPGDTKTVGWTERMKIATYIALHWIYMKRSDEWPSALAHRAYVEALPPSSSFRTPLHFSESELTLLEGTNLHSAVLDRAAEWKHEADSVRAVVGEGLTWERYLTAATCISSRAFPSRLLALENAESNGISSEGESSPVLLPGVDLFNHSRAQPILWLSSQIPSSSSSSPTTTTPAVSLVSATSIPPSTQVFNNYGPKPNDELLLGYGFTIPSNPDDLVYLRLGTVGLSADAVKRVRKIGLDVGERFKVGRDGKVPARLMEVMRALLGSDDEEEHGHEDNDDDDEEGEHDHDHGKEEEEMNLEVDVLDMLSQMLSSKLKRVQSFSSTLEKTNVRLEVLDMCRQYRQGQEEIMTAALREVRDRVQRVETLLEEGMGCPCCM